MMDLLLSQRFLPEFGGSIRWMHEVYRRWPRPVEVITHDYYRVPPNTAGLPVVPAPPDGRDHVTDTNLRMDRRDILLHDWGMEHPRSLLRYARMTRAVSERLRSGGGSGGGGKDLVRVHCPHAVPEVVSLLPLKWAYPKRLKIISYAHGEEITACCSSRQLRWFMHRAHHAVDLMIANSASTRTLLEGHIDPDKVHVVHPGVDIHAFEPAEQAGHQWRVQQGLRDKLVVLTVGRLDARKNHRAVIQAVADLVPHIPQLVYVIAGQGGMMKELQALARQRGVADRVVFAGAVDGATKLAMYGGCDVFAMPAIRVGTDVEGFGMVFLEAGACGKPTLAGSVGGQAEAVADGETGLVVDGSDQSAVTGSLERLLLDAGLRGRLGAAGRVHARKFDWPHVVQRTVELVEKMEEGGSIRGGVVIPQLTGR